MKKNILFIAILLIQAVGFAQQSKKDSILNSIKNYREVVFRDASVFLNSNLGTAARINAIKQHPVIYDENQKALFKRIALNSKEEPELRAIALNKIYGEVEKDEKFLEEVISWFGNPQTPKPLRDETLNLVGNLSFSMLPGILEVYNQMVSDPLPNFRSFAFTKLVVNGDARAQQLLINGLENPANRQLEPIPAMQILSLAPKKDHYPAVLKVLESSKNNDERMVAIQILEGYSRAKDKLAAIFMSPQEQSAIREAALVSFYSGNKAEAVKYVPRILKDESASNNLRILSIQIAINERKRMAYRKTAKRADDVDTQIKAIADNRNNDPELYSTAQRYMLLVRPNF